MSLLALAGVVCLVAVVAIRVALSGDFHPWAYRLLGIGRPTNPVSGLVEPEFQAVRKVFEEHFDKGMEVGASVAVFADGRRVVELYGGYADYARGVVYSEDTLQLVFSSSKVLGLIGYDDLVTSIWPEFGAGGKGGVTIADVMRHEAGVPYIDGPKPAMEDLMDRSALAALLAKQEYSGKRQRCYHAMTRGWLLNEIVQRVDPQGRSLGQIYQQEFNCLPGVEFHLGLANEHRHRRARWYSRRRVDMAISTVLPQYIASPRVLSDVPLDAWAPSAPISRAVANAFGSGNVGNQEFLTKFEIPSANGFTSAASLATIGAHLANGGSLDGYTLLSNTCLHAALGDPVKDFDTGLYIDTIMTRAGLGVYILDGVRFYGWAGMGGSGFVFSLEHNFSFAYAMNAGHSTLTLSGRARRLLLTAFRAHRASKAS